MKTFVGILAVAAIAVALSISSASDVQTLSNAQMGSFSGGCPTPCKIDNAGATCDNYTGEDPSQPGVFATNGCWDLGTTSEKYADDYAVADGCGSSWPASTCDPDGGYVHCGTSGNKRMYDYWAGNDGCQGDPEDEPGDSYHDIESAIGTGPDC